MSSLLKQQNVGESTRIETEIEHEQPMEPEAEEKTTTADLEEVSNEVKHESIVYKKVDQKSKRKAGLYGIHFVKSPGDGTDNGQRRYAYTH